MHIKIVWHVEDVQSIRPDLNVRQCCSVLTAARDNHDATIGINWEVLSCIAQELYPEKG